MRRVDDHEAAHRRRAAAPPGSRRRAPPQSCATSASTWPPSSIDQRGDVGDQVLGAIGLDLGRRRRALVAAQVGRDAAVAVAEKRRAARPRRTPPRESRAGRASTGVAAAAGGAAAEHADAVAAATIVRGLDHATPPFARRASRRARARRRRRPARLSAENSVDADVVARSPTRRRRATSLAALAAPRRASRAVQLVGLGQQHEQLDRAVADARRDEVEQLAVDLGEAEPRVDQQRRSRAGCGGLRGSRPSPAASAAWRCARRRRSRSPAGRRTAHRRASFGPSSNRLMCCVRPGVFEAKARRFCCVRTLIAVDLPALERPTKAISGSSVDGQLGRAGWRW